MGDDVDATVNTRAWQSIANAHPAPRGPGTPPRRVEWTTSPEVGPGTEVLGDLAGASVVELGCGTGENLACVATCGTRSVIGVDIAESRIGQARARWGHLPGVSWWAGPAVDALIAGADLFDVVYSVFGALWYSDPAELLPLIRRRMRRGGLLAFSVGCPRPGQLQGRRVDNLTLDGGTRLPVVHYAYDPPAWDTLLGEHRFTVDQLLEVPPSTRGGSPTLVVTAHR